ncbi:MAG: hypothetical protein RL385_6091, partial [Pseudomonadota bacterium]
TCSERGEPLTKLGPTCSHVLDQVQTREDAELMS